MKEIRDSTKDFLSHLRLVHFGLAVTSLVLFVASAIAPPYVLENAYRQAGELRRIESINISSWLGKSVSPTSQVRNLFDESPFSISDGNTTLSLAIDEWSFFVDKKSLVALVRNAELVSLERYNEPDVPFETLSTFKSLWNDLRRMRHTPAIVGWSPENADFMPLGSAEWQTGNFMVVRGSNNPSQPHLHVDRTEFIKSKDGQISLVIWFRSVSHDVQAIVKALRIPITLERKDYQDLLATEMRVEWRQGEFADSFKDLERFAKNLGSLNFRELEDHLGSLASDVGPPIQLLGAAIPTRSLQTWGPAILLVIQAYFFLHFRRFKKTIRDPGESQFAWLGIYDDGLSRLLFSFSVSLLPVSAVLTIGVLSQDILLLPLNPANILLIVVSTSSLTVGFATLVEVSETARKLYRLLLRR